MVIDNVEKGGQPADVASVHQPLQTVWAAVGVSARFYLTFLVGPARTDGTRGAGVRLQLERGGGIESFDGAGSLDQAAVAAAPDLTIGASRVRLQGLRYHLTLDLRSAEGRRAAGDLFIDGAAGEMLPPIEIHGAGGWRSGYVVPVMSGVLGGTILVDGERISLDGGVGYHDHNWGFWEGVSWKWGQVQEGDLSVVYGRVFPPADAADPDRIPGFLVAIAPDWESLSIPSFLMAEIQRVSRQTQSPCRSFSGRKSGRAQPEASKQDHSLDEHHRDDRRNLGIGRSRRQAVHPNTQHAAVARSARGVRSARKRFRST